MDMMKCPKCGFEAADKDAMMAHWNEAHPGEAMPAEAGDMPAAGGDMPAGEEHHDDQAAM